MTREAWDTHDTTAFHCPIEMSWKYLLPDWGCATLRHAVVNGTSWSVFFAEMRWTSVTSCCDRFDTDMSCCGQQLMIANVLCVSSPFWSPVLLQTAANRPTAWKVISLHVFTEPDLISHYLAGTWCGPHVANPTPLFTVQLVTTAIFMNWHVTTLIL